MNKDRKEEAIDFQQALELLAPAGDFQRALVAFENGADAVYLGLKQFSARAKASNFSFSDLERLKGFAQLKGKKIYVALNTLLKEEEIPEALVLVDKLNSIGIDALILQDIALLKLIRTHFPSLVLHASTQMAISNKRGLQMAKELGIKRVILPRETSLKDLKNHLAEEARALGLELEMFIQGAMCYSFSGLCLFSGRTLGFERSGNRGSCAQMCRSYYSNEKGQKSYPFSCQDMSAGNLILELRNLGVVSFKIEGRLKGPSYVASNLAYYRRFLDSNIPFKSPEEEQEYLNKIRLNFAREFCPGHLKGGQAPFLFTNKNYPKNLGVFLGEVEGVFPHKKMIQLKDQKKDSHHAYACELGKNDRILVLKEGFNEKGMSFSIKEILSTRGLLIHLFSQDEYDEFSKISKGDKLYLIQSAKMLSSTPPLQDEKKYPRFKVKKIIKASYDGKILLLDGKAYPLESETLRKNLNTLSWQEQLKKVFSETGDSSFVFDLDFERADAKVLEDIENTEDTLEKDFFIPLSFQKSIRNQFLASFEEKMRRETQERLNSILSIRNKNDRSSLSLPQVPRSFLSLKDSVPYAHLSHLKESLEKNTLDLFSTWDGKIVIPLLPIISPHEEDEYEKIILKLLESFSSKFDFLIGIDHISHLKIYKAINAYFEDSLTLKRRGSLFYFQDAHAYSLSLEGEEKFLFSYESSEENFSSPLYEGVPLMISKICYLKNNLYGGDCSKCQLKPSLVSNSQRTYKTTLKNNQKSFSLIIKDCLNYIL